ncbi:MAG: restriction endonuclease subunit S, partial [Thermoguttaceae bacterium]|nr:restriction endonuclease subunit S [Thermoguttaceae bacterium]
MRKMKDSGIPWIGEIPISWTVRRLKNVATVQTGSTPSKTMQTSYYSDTSGLPWIKPENLGINTPISETAEYLTHEGKVSARLFPPNTVYVCCIGSIGKTGYSFTEASCNQQVNAIVFLNMFWKYGYYVTIAQESEYLSNASGNVVKILNSETQKNIVFPYPSLKEQRNIANFLDAECARIDAIIEQTRATVEEYKKLKQSIITQAVTKGIRPNRPMKDSGIEWIGEIPEEWEVQRFKNVTKINGRIGFRGYTTDDLVSEGEGAITLSPSNIVDLKIIYEKCS